MTRDIDFAFHSSQQRFGTHGFAFYSNRVDVVNSTLNDGVTSCTSQIFRGVRKRTVGS